MLFAQADSPVPTPKSTVVCFGDSITCGQVSANYVEMLEQRMGAEGYGFVNAGVNNDMTDNLLRRVSAVASEKPDYVIILAGSNDVIATLSYQSALFYILNKRIYRWPKLNGSYQRLAQIVRKLKVATQAEIAVASIPVLGEDLESFPMQRVRHYNQRISQIAEQLGAAYLPVFERQSAYLLSKGKASGRVYRGNMPETARLVTRRLFLREDFDTFSERMGYQLLVDGVHMNNRGAGIIADTIEAFLRSRTPPARVRPPTLPEDQKTPQTAE